MKTSDQSINHQDFTLGMIFAVAICAKGRNSHDVCSGTGASCPASFLVGEFVALNYWLSEVDQRMSEGLVPQVCRIEGSLQPHCLCVWIASLQSYSLGCTDR